MLARYEEQNRGSSRSESVLKAARICQEYRHIREAGPSSNRTAISALGNSFLVDKFTCVGLEFQLKMETLMCFFLPGIRCTW